MLTTTFLQGPLLQPAQFNSPSSFLPLFKPLRRKNTCRNVLESKCAPCKDDLVSTATRYERTIALSEFGVNPDGGSPGTACDQWLLDVGAISSVILSCSNVREIKRAHAAVLKSLETSVTFVDNNLISAYVRFGRLDNARTLFDRMPDRNVVSWTALLNGYSKMELEDEFLRLYVEMIKSGIQANCLTFVCVLDFCSKRSDFEFGKQAHASILKGNWRNLIVDSALINFYAQCGDLSVAFRIFDTMKRRDIVCWTTMITACAQQGLENEVFSLFSRMQDYGFSPNEFTVCSVLKACGEQKALKFGRQLHGAIVKGICIDDVYVGSSLVGMYVRCGEVADARTIFDLMLNRNTVTWTSMIAGYAQNGQGEEALRLFQRMKRRRIFANDLTVVSILTACGSIGSLCLGKEVHAQIVKNCIQDNVHIGNTLVWLYCKCSKYAYAAKVLEFMPMKDVVSWTAIISGCTGLGRDSLALDFLNKMLCEGIEPNPLTYSSALKACSKLEALVQGKWIHASISKSCSLANVFVSSALISLYMKCARTDDALRVFDMMPERNLVSWKTMIVGYAKNGLCAEALKLMYRMEAEGFKVDEYVISTVLSSCGDIRWESD